MNFIDHYKHTSDITHLLEATPEFSDPRKFFRRHGLNEYVSGWHQSTAMMSFVLENFYPGVVAYLEHEFSGRINDRFFLDVMNWMAQEMFSKHRKTGDVMRPSRGGIYFFSTTVDEFVAGEKMGARERFANSGSSWTNEIMKEKLLATPSFQEMYNRVEKKGKIVKATKLANAVETALENNGFLITRFREDEVYVLRDGAVQRVTTSLGDTEEVWEVGKAVETLVEGTDQRKLNWHNPLAAVIQHLHSGDERNYFERGRILGKDQLDDLFKHKWTLESSWKVFPFHGVVDYFLEKNKR